MLLFTYQTGGLMISMLWVFMAVVLMRGIACETFHLNRVNAYLVTWFQEARKGFIVYGDEVTICVHLFCLLPGLFVSSIILTKVAYHNSNRSTTRYFPSTPTVNPQESSWRYELGSAPAQQQWKERWL